MTNKTDLPVMLPVKRRDPEPFLGLKLRHVLPIALLAILGPHFVYAQSSGDALTPLAVLLSWAPLLLKGFIFNL